MTAIGTTPDVVARAKARIPATFFVATRFIDSSNRPWWVDCGGLLRERQPALE